jgi:hypothetical protein
MAVFAWQIQFEAAVAPPEVVAYVGQGKHAPVPIVALYDDLSHGKHTVPFKVLPTSQTHDVPSLSSIWFEPKQAQKLALVAGIIVAVAPVGHGKQKFCESPGTFLYDVGPQTTHKPETDW